KRGCGGGQRNRGLTPPARLGAGLGAAGVLLAIYLVVFYWSEPLHWQGLLMLLLPDQLVREWMGGSPQRIAVLDRVPMLLAAAGLLAMAGLIGVQWLRWLRVDRLLTPGEQAVFGGAAGLHAVSLWTLAAGLAGQLHRPWLVVAPPLLLAAWSAVRILWPLIGRAREANGRAGPAADQDDLGDRETGGGPVPPASQHWRSERYLAWLLVPLAVVLLAGGALPPSEFDVREYHLQVPKEWQQEGRVTFLPHNVYGNMPLGAEMPALLAMAAWPAPDGWWWGALVGKLVIAACSLLTAAGLYTAGCRFLNRTAGLLAALLYLSVPWVAHVSMAGLNDGVVGMYAFLAIYAGILAVDNTSGSSRRLALLCGWLAGAAAACKYPALLLLVVPLSGWVLLAGCRWPGRQAANPETLDQRTPGRRFGGLQPVRWAVFAAAVLLSCGLWYGKNWVLTGNPTYPLLVSVFGGSTRTEAKDQQWRQAHQVPRDAQGRSYTPAQLGGSLSQIGWRSPWIAPCLVPLALLGLAGWRRWPVVSPLAAWLAFYVLVWWLVTHRIDRFLVPALPAAALLAGAGAVCCDGRVWRAIAVAAVGWSVLAGLTIISSRAFPADNRFLVALAELRPDLSDPRDPDFCFTNPVHDWLNRHVPDGGRVLLVGDAQPFDLRVPALYATCFDTNPLESIVDAHATAAERRAALRAAGITHVYIQWSEIDRYRGPGNYGFSSRITRSLVRDELVESQQVLRQLSLEQELGLDPERSELFEVLAE
ncbi:MAG: glycosyltransferase family 39 protein, partial [Pirellulaceae bacterium]|nr:glycosyltransferase family 39 protein [Pirellulaceae bacterium]